MQQKSNLIKPDRLRPGDTVGIVSPSFFVPSDLMLQWELGISVLRDWGLKVKIGEHALTQRYYSAGSRTERLDDFHALWSDREVRMVLMSQGGYTANALLDGLNYDLLRGEPKIFCGISDGTVLLNAITARAGIITFHGPDLLFTFGRTMTLPIKEHLRSVLFDGAIPHLEPNPLWQHQDDSTIASPSWQTIRSGQAVGPLVGGHIRALCFNLLEGYCPDLQQAVMFLEGTEKIYQLEAEFTALKLAGVFSKISGMILGWFDNSQPTDKRLQRSVAEMVLEVSRDYSFPILSIGELGHNVENFIFPIGAKVFLDAGERVFRWIESPLAR